MVEQCAGCIVVKHSHRFALGVPVVNTDLDSVLQTLRSVVTVITAFLGAEVEFTLRQRNRRPRAFEREGAYAFSVNFFENASLQQDVQVDKSLTFSACWYCGPCSCT